MNRLDAEQVHRLIAENRTLKKQIRQQKKSFFETFSKAAVTILLVNAIAWVWCSYILAFLGGYEIAQSLSQTAIEVILGTLLGYFAKSAIENVNKHGINYIPRQQEPPDDYDGSYNRRGG